MPRKKIGAQTALITVRGHLAEKLANELKSSRECGQPLVYEQEYATGKIRVTVIWDVWADASLEERSAVILRAYEIAEGPEYRERIALASGLTVPEAAAAGMLRFQLIAALRRGDPVTMEQARQAFLEEGASQLLNPEAPELRFATREEAEASKQRLVKRFPGTEDVWIIRQDWVPAAEE
jgi:hypothetical protein